MADYSAEIVLARELLSEFGMNMVYVREIRQGDGFNPETGLPDIIQEKTSFMGVKTRPTLEEMQAGAYEGSTLVVLAAAADLQGITPKTKDKLQFSGNDWDIEQVVIVSPAESPILYKFGVKDAGAVA